MSYVTVSTKVKKQIVEKAKEYGLNISETLRKALEEEVRKKKLNGPLQRWRKFQRKQS
jgi:hypothetical protein